MLAKTLEARYQDAAELARDLRECERQLAASGAATVPPGFAKPIADATTVQLASGPEPELLDTNAKSAVLAQTLNRTRLADQTTEEIAAPPAHGLAHVFNSSEATQRLASLTGAATQTRDERETATQAIESLKKAPRAGWRRRDWLVVAGAGLLGLVAARAIVRSRRGS
jgi:hypothetical protein